MRHTLRLVRKTVGSMGVLSGLFVGCVVTAHAADHTQEFFAPIDPSILSAFSAAIQRGGVFAAKDPPASSMTSEQSLIWAGSSAQARTELKRSVIEFADDSQRSFSISIEHLSKFLTLKVPDALDKRFRNGFFLEPSPFTSTRQYIALKDNLGVLAFLPRTGQSDWTGIALCPVTVVSFQDERKRQKKKLSASGVRATSVSTPVHGSAKGSYRSGLAQAQVTVQIFTSPNIEPIGQSEEKVIDINPEAEIEYSPASVSSNGASEQKSLVSGIRSFVELTAPGGQKRVVTSESIVAVGNFPLSQSTNLPLSGNESPIESAICFAVLRHTNNTEHFEGT